MDIQSSWTLYQINYWIAPNFDITALVKERGLSGVGELIRGTQNYFSLRLLTFLFLNYFL
jgi:hypothetical protein